MAAPSPAAPSAAPSGAPRPAPPRRGAFARLGLWLLGALWPAVALFLGIALLLWDRAEPRTVWILSAAGALLFLVLFAAMRRRLRGAGRSVANAVRSVLFAFVVSALVVLLVWWAFFRA
jgi:hypothetical protein